MIAAKANLSPITLSRYMSGSVLDIRPDHLARLALVLKRRPVELVGLVDDSNPRQGPRARELRSR